MITITPSIKLPDEEIELKAIHSQGAGGQNVNKVATAIHLRLDISRSSLPDPIKLRLLNCKDRRINKDGILVIKAQRYRSQDKNRVDAISRLIELIRTISKPVKKRIQTKPSKRSKMKRLEQKIETGKLKQLRKKPGISGDT